MPNDHPQSLKHLLIFLYNSSKFFTAEIELIKKKIPLNKLSKLSSVAWKVVYPPKNGYQMKCEFKKGHAVMSPVY